MIKDKKRNNSIIIISIHLFIYSFNFLVDLSIPTVSDPNSVIILHSYKQ